MRPCEERRGHQIIEIPIPKCFRFPEDSVEEDVVVADVRRQRVVPVQHREVRDRRRVVQHKGIGRPVGKQGVALVLNLE